MPAKAVEATCAVASSLCCHCSLQCSLAPSFPPSLADSSSAVLTARFPPSRQRKQIPLETWKDRRSPHWVLLLLLSTVVQLFSVKFYAALSPIVGTTFLPFEEVMVPHGVKPPKQALHRPYGATATTRVGIGA
ncbi:unnamed protein product, partial [Ectocarpus sp. 12 AP-2014]